MSNLDLAMDELNTIFLSLCAMVEENVQSATAVLLGVDTDEIQNVADKDREIDQLEIKVEEQCLSIIAMYHPVAKELRRIAAILKINNDLERIGDLGVNIARSAKRFSGPKDVTLVGIPDLVTKVRAMLKKSLDALIKQDGELALEVCRLDDEVDELKRNAKKLVLDHIKKDPENANIYYELSINSRRLERIADLATNIAEEVIYMTKGEVIRHKKWDEA